MTPSECQKVRDLVARNRLLEQKVERLEHELAFLQKRANLEPTVVRRLRNRLAQQRARAEMWKARALGRPA